MAFTKLCDVFTVTTTCCMFCTWMLVGREGQCLVSEMERRNLCPSLVNFEIKRRDMQSARKREGNADT